MRLRFPISLAGSAGMSIQGGLDAVDQGRCSKGLGQEANGARLQRLGADALFGEGRDKHKRHVITLGAYMCEKVQPAHNRHLHIRDDARRVVQMGRLQEFLGRRKCMDQVSMRAEKIVGRGTDVCIVVND